MYKYTQIEWVTFPGFHLLVLLIEFLVAETLVFISASFYFTRKMQLVNFQKIEVIFLNSTIYILQACLYSTVENQTHISAEAQIILT